MRMIAIMIAPVALAACSPNKAGDGPSNTATAPQASPTAVASASLSPAATPAPATIAVNLAPDGLSFVDPATGNSRNVAFGVPRATIDGAMAAATGKPGERGHSPECGAGPMDFSAYRDGLKLTFQDGKFIGWTINREPGKGFSTASGIGIGSTRAELEKAYDVSVEEGSLGIEFGAGNLAGILDGDGKTAKVTDIWAGTVCILD